MVNAVVVYRSKSGFVRKYAEWIADELEADIFDASKFTAEMLAGYDTVIYGGGLYAVGINGVRSFLKNLDRLEDKKVVVFATGASPARKEAINEVRNRNFTPEQLRRIGFFYLRGGFDYNKLKPVDKLLMILLKLKILFKKKNRLEADERGMLAAYNQPVDFTKRKHIHELITYVKTI